MCVCVEGERKEGKEILKRVLLHRVSRSLLHLLSRSVFTRKQKYRQNADSRTKSHTFTAFVLLSSSHADAHRSLAFPSFFFFSRPSMREGENGRQTRSDPVALVRGKEGQKKEGAVTRVRIICTLIWPWR